MKKERKSPFFLLSVPLYQCSFHLDFEALVPRVCIHIRGGKSGISGSDYPDDEEGKGESLFSSSFLVPLVLLCAHLARYLLTRVKQVAASLRLSISK